MRVRPLLTLALVAILDISAVHSRPALAQRAQILIVSDDVGGPIGARAMEISRINAGRVPVEIRGDLCFSSCTMYLGAEDVCVSSDTVFGFHGPSYSEGESMAESWFEFWSEIMVRHYSPALGSWFMQEARYAGPDRVLRVLGRNLAPLGYRICET